MLDPNDPQNFTRWFTHHLVVALRFVDVFTPRPVEPPPPERTIEPAPPVRSFDTPLRVTIPELGWKAVHRATDSTYRFVVTEANVPTGTFRVIVEDPDQRYVNHSPITLTLPLTSPGLVEHALWPTRKFKVPTGETAMVGRLVSTSASFSPADQPPPTMPFARSNQNGEFLFRLPEVSRESDGTPRPASMAVQVTREGVPVGSVAPSTFVPDPGQVQFIRFEIP